MKLCDSKARIMIMAKLTFIVLLFCSIFASSSVYAWDNCPFGEINEPFPGTCGRYIDTDNDNICDLSQPSPESRISPSESSTGSVENSSVLNVSSNLGVNYYFIPILILMFVLYGITFFLSKKNVIGRIQHRKIWNVILLVTFLISGILGIILAILVSYGIRLPYYSDLLFWHVETGIAMAVVSIFHVGWHWKYYKNMVIKNH